MVCQVLQAKMKFPIDVLVPMLSLGQLSQTFMIIISPLNQYWDLKIFPYAVAVTSQRKLSNDNVFICLFRFTRIHFLPNPDLVNYGFSEFKFGRGDNPADLARNNFEELQFTRSSKPKCLVPLEKEVARKNTLSKIVGRAEQNPHTDGAHLSNPPLYLLLWSMESNDIHAKTNVWKANLSELEKHFLNEFRNSIWCVRTRADRFHYRRCLGRDGSIRWDSGCFIHCMTGPLNSEEVDQQLSGLSKFEITWEPGKAVLIDNRMALHGRGDSTSAKDDNRRIYRVYFYGL